VDVGDDPRTLCRRGHPSGELRVAGVPVTVTARTWGCSSEPHDGGRRPGGVPVVRRVLLLHLSRLPADAAAPSLFAHQDRSRVAGHVAHGVPCGRRDGSSTRFVVRGQAAVGCRDVDARPGRRVAPAGAAGYALSDGPSPRVPVGGNRDRPLGPNRADRGPVGCGRTGLRSGLGPELPSGSPDRPPARPPLSRPFGPPSSSPSCWRYSARWWRALPSRGYAAPARGWTTRRRCCSVPARS
jgi:hypothetical protein